MAAHNRLSPEIRRRALRMIADGVPVREVAEQLAISPSAIREWMHADDPIPLDATGEQFRQLAVALRAWRR